MGVSIRDRRVVADTIYILSAEPTEKSVKRLATKERGERRASINRGERRASIDRGERRASSDKVQRRAWSVQRLQTKKIVKPMSPDNSATSSIELRFLRGALRLPSSIQS